MGDTILEMDGAEHLRHRALISRAFTRRALDRWERELVRPIVNAYVDHFAARGAADLVRELTFPFPVHVIAGMIGLPEEDHADFHRLAVELISIGIDCDGAASAPRASCASSSRRSSRRAARQPRDDLISVLAHAELEGTRLSDEEIYSLPVPARAGGRRDDLPLVEQPALRAAREPGSARRRAQRPLADRRRRSRRACAGSAPLLAIMRTATRDTELAGVAIPAGAPVAVNLGAANRDPARWDDPDRFDVFRAAEAAHRLRRRAARLPRHAPRADGDARAARRALRAAAEPAPRPRGEGRRTSAA